MSIPYGCPDSFEGVMIARRHPSPVRADRAKPNVLPRCEHHTAVGSMQHDGTLVVVGDGDSLTVPATAVQVPATDPVKQQLWRAKVQQASRFHASGPVVNPTGSIGEKARSLEAERRRVDDRNRAYFPAMNCIHEGEPIACVHQHETIVWAGACAVVTAARGSL